MVDSLNYLSRVEQKAKNRSFFMRMRWYHYFAGTTAFIVIYQAILMYLWLTYPQYDNMILRFSLSNSDGMSISAWAMGILAMYVVEKKFENAGDNVEKICNEWGVDKKKVKILMKEFGKMDEKQFEQLIKNIGIVTKILSKIDAEKLEKLSDYYISKMNRMKTFEEMETDFNLDSMHNAAPITTETPISINPCQECNGGLNSENCKKCNDDGKL